MSIISLFFKKYLNIPNPEYGLTIDEQHAEKERQEAKQAKIRQEWLVNTFPQMVKATQAKSLANRPKRNS